MKINNKCFFIGRTGGDISVTRFEDGNCIGNVSLAIDQSYKNKQGEKVQQTTWLNLVAHNKTCEVFERYVPKGSKIAVETFYKVRQWQDKDGNNRYNHEFVVLSMEFMSSKSDNQSQGNYQQQNTAPTQQRNAPQAQGSGVKDDDDLPF